MDTRNTKSTNIIGDRHPRHLARQARDRKYEGCMKFLFPFVFLFVFFLFEIPQNRRTSISVFSLLKDWLHAFYSKCPTFSIHEIKCGASP